MGRYSPHGNEHPLLQHLGLEIFLDMLCSYSREYIATKESESRGAEEADS
jgi:hypothetical protein